LIAYGTCTLAKAVGPTGQRRLEGKERKRIEDWRVHDIRRVVRTHLSALPVTDLVRELIMANAQSRLHKT
jgi:hypothetical protein